MAVMCPLIVADFYFLLEGIFKGNWITITLNAIAIVVGIWAIRGVYRRANSIEESMQRNIQTVMNLQLFDLMRKAFENHPDAFQNGFGANPKDKTDEVEADK